MLVYYAKIVSASFLRSTNFKYSDIIILYLQFLNRIINISEYLMLLSNKIGVLE